MPNSDGWKLSGTFQEHQQRDREIVAIIEKHAKADVRKGKTKRLTYSEAWDLWLKGER